MTDQQRAEAPQRVAKDWTPAYPCDHCEGGTVWVRAYVKECVRAREHRCDWAGCTIYRRVG